MLAEWLGGPDDGKMLEIQDGVTSIVIAVYQHNPFAFTDDGDLGPTEVAYDKRVLPIRTRVGVEEDERGNLYGVRKKMIVYHPE